MDPVLAALLADVATQAIRSLATYLQSQNMTPAQIQAEVDGVVTQGMSDAGVSNSAFDAAVEAWKKRHPS